MSGGVDSSVAAYLLKEEGYDVVGVTMRLWSDDVIGASSNNKSCCSVEDAQDAKRVAHILGFPHYVLNFEREFKAHVMDYFVQEYRRGRTPHPCIACNDKIKFAFFLQRALSFDAEVIATGHYVRREDGPDGPRLLKAVDDSKDQTYVLYGLKREEIERSLFPIGEIPKSEVRDIARRLELPTADKPDSQEICFVPQGDYRKFLAPQIPAMSGVIMDLDGKHMGEHDGVTGYTVGQRKGLPSSPDGRRLYVVSLDASANTVVVGHEDSLYSTGLRASGANFLNDPFDHASDRVTVKIRYKSPEVGATLSKLEGDGAFEVRFDDPQRAVTPGQAVVIYRGEQMIGGGVVDEAFQAVPVAAI
jgi:tRNA-specific 2-thiouridylase